MKKLMFMLSFLLFLSFIGTAQVEVGADKSFEAPIDEYKTYQWSNKIDQIPQDAVYVGPNGVMVFNNETTRSKIKEAVQYELDTKGYTMDNSNADMIVIFSILEQPATLKTYNGYKMYNQGMDSTRTPDNVESTEVSAGTLLINIIDAKTSKVAWQAYASGILTPDMMNDESKIRHAVSSMFEQFKHTARK